MLYTFHATRSCAAVFLKQRNKYENGEEKVSCSKAVRKGFEQMGVRDCEMTERMTSRKGRQRRNIWRRPAFSCDKKDALTL